MLEIGNIIKPFLLRRYLFDPRPNEHSKPSFNSELPLLVPHGACLLHHYCPCRLYFNMLAPCKPYLVSNFRTWVLGILPWHQARGKILCRLSVQIQKLWYNKHTFKGKFELQVPGSALPQSRMRFGSWRNLTENMPLIFTSYQVRIFLTFQRIDGIPSGKLKIFWL